jgi:hypothetical protein
LFPSLKLNRIRERERKKDVPIPITAPYSSFLSAETAGGQRKKTKEREEMTREECFLGEQM